MLIEQHAQRQFDLRAKHRVQEVQERRSEAGAVTVAPGKVVGQLMQDNGLAHGPGAQTVRDRDNRSGVLVVRPRVALTGTDEHRDTGARVLGFNRRQPTHAIHIGLDGFDAGEPGLGRQGQRDAAHGSHRVANLDGSVIDTAQTVLRVIELLALAVAAHLDTAGAMTQEVPALSCSLTVW